jgi:hypothetical protein
MLPWKHVIIKAQAVVVQQQHLEQQPVVLVA